VTGVAAGHPASARILPVERPDARYDAGISPGSSPVAIGIPARLQSEYEPG
jgi:hypothetical protein